MILLVEEYSIRQTNDMIYCKNINSCSRNEYVCLTLMHFIWREQITQMLIYWRPNMGRYSDTEHLNE
jgi:hypothetical protein